MATNNPPQPHQQLTITGSASGALELGQEGSKRAARHSTFIYLGCLEKQYWRILSSYKILTAEDIVNIKFVDKSWAAWDTDDANTIAHARQL